MAIICFGFPDLQSMCYYIMDYFKRQKHDGIIVSN